MSSTVIQDLDDFVNVHGLLLASSGIPPSLYNQLFLKLSSETFDGGDFFQIEPCEDGRQRRLVLSSDPMEKESHLFLVDHAWTFRLSDARKQVGGFNSSPPTLFFCLVFVFGFAHSPRTRTRRLRKH